MPGMNMFPSGSTLQIPLDACTNFSGEAGNAQVTLTWTDPKDKYATPEGETAQDPDQLVSVWEYTQIIRKTGSQPTGPHDGELVVSSSVRDQYQTTGFVDDGLTNDTLYYYAAFAYNTDGVASEGAFTSATPMAGTPIGELAEGTLITINESGSPKEFYVAKQNYEEARNGAGRTLVVRKDCYSTMAFDDTSNIFNKSDIALWLNYTYFNLFSAAVKSLIGTTSFPTYGGGSVYSVVKNIGLLSMREMGGYVSDNLADEGSPLPIVSTLKKATLNGEAISWWTRSPLLTNTSSAWILNESGNSFFLSVSSQVAAARPCFTLPSTATVDQDLNLIES